MILREYLRYLILGSPFILPDLKQLFPLFKYEITNNVHFMIFIFFVFIFILYFIFLIWTYNRNSNLVISYGFLLIGCSLILHKLKVIEFLNFKIHENKKN